MVREESRSTRRGGMTARLNGFGGYTAVALLRDSRAALLSHDRLRALTALRCRSADQRLVERRQAVSACKGGGSDGRGNGYDKCGDNFYTHEMLQRKVEPEN